MGTMLDQAELRGEARGEKRGMEKQRKLDEAELKKQASRIAELEAQLKEAQLAKK